MLRLETYSAQMPAVTNGGCRKSPLRVKALSHRRERLTMLAMNLSPTTSSWLSALRKPMSLAALLTWLAVFATVMFGVFGSRVVERGVTVPTAVAMLVFLSCLLADILKVERCPGTGRAVALVELEATAALAVLALTGDGSVPALFVILAVQIAHLPSRLRWLLMAINNLGLIGVLLWMWPLGGAIATFTLYAGFQAFATLTAFYARSAENSRDALRLVNAELLATQSLLEDSARSHERLRLSRELHDVSGHKLTALKLQLAALARDPAGAPPAVGIAARLADELLGDIRGVVSQMREGDGLDLGRAIEELAAPIPRPRVSITIEPNLRIDDIAQARALLRAAQEALTNAARHSQAEQVWLTLGRHDGVIELVVRDNGRGAINPGSGNGLTGMRERLEDVGGGLRISGDDGFRVTAWVPGT
ncbi:MAG: histidine kinase [Dokdonella sp.]